MEEKRLNIKKPENIFVTDLDINLNLTTSSQQCLFCHKPIEDVWQVTVLNGTKLGAFCSRICRDMGNSLYASIIPVKNTMTAKLLPLQFYDTPDIIREYIEKKPEKPLFGGHINTRGQVAQIRLRFIKLD